MVIIKLKNMKKININVYYMNINSVNEKLLNVLYYSPSTGISSAKKLYEKVKQRGITFQQVKDYISKQEAHQIFKKQSIIKNYFPIVAKYKNEVLQIDLADMSNISSVNDGVKFLFIAIDVFSRLAYVIPLRNKKYLQLLMHLLKSLMKQNHIL